MSDPEIPRFDPEPWKEYIRDKLAIGSRVEWEFATIGRVAGCLGDALELRPILSLSRYTQSEEVLAGCRVIQYDTQQCQESRCLLSWNDLLSLSKLTARNECVTEGS